MTRWASIGALVVLASACDIAIGIRSFGPGDVHDAPVAVDAPTADAFLHPCAGRVPTPMFCADFDAGTPLVFVGAFPQTFAMDTADATAKLRAPAISGTTALWIDSTGGDLYKIYPATNMPVSRLDATFWLNMTAPMGMSTGLFRLTLSGNSVTCYVNLQIEGTPQQLYLNGFCPANSGTPVIIGLPIGWTKVHMIFDRTNGTAMVGLGDPATTTAMIDFGGGAIGNVDPSIQIGLESPDNLRDFSIGYDDLEVTGD